MKSNQLLALIMALFLFNGSCKENPEPETNIYDEEYLFSLVEDEKYDIIGATRDGEVIALSSENGIFPEEIFYQNKHYPGFYLWLDENGMLKKGYINGHLLFFENITTEKVDVGVLFSNGHTEIIRDIGYDFSGLLELNGELKKSLGSADAVNWGKVLKYGGIALDAAICAAALSGSLTGVLAPVLAPIAAVSCVSAFAGIVVEVVDAIRKDDKFGDFMNFYSASTGSIPTPGSLLSIAGAIVQDATEAENTRSTQANNLVSELIEMGSDGYTIYYASDQTGNRNIFIGELSGTELANRKQITNYSGTDQVIGFDVCKTTRRIVIVVSQDGRNGDIYILENDKSDPFLLPNQPEEKSGALIYWSLTGNEIIYSQGAARYYNDLVIMKAKTDGSSYSEIISTDTPMNRACHKTTIHQLNDGMIIGVTPQWAAASTDHELWRRNNDNSYTNITNTASIGERFAYVSPNGSNIVFQTLDNNLAQGIRYMPTGGGSQTTIITHSTQNIVFPNGWVDDNTIIYSYKSNNAEEKYDLYMVSIDGSDPVNISNTPEANITHAVLIK